MENASNGRLSLGQSYKHVTWAALQKIADRIWIQRTRNLNGGVPSALKDYPTILKSCYIFYEQKKKNSFEMHLFGRCGNARLKIKKHKHFCRPFMKLSISFLLLVPVSFVRVVFLRFNIYWRIKFNLWKWSSQEKLPNLSNNWRCLCLPFRWICWSGCLETEGHSF